MGVFACLGPSSHPCRRAYWRLKVNFPMDPISPRLQEPRGSQEFLLGLWLFFGLGGRLFKF